MIWKIYWKTIKILEELNQKYVKDRQFLIFDLRLTGKRIIIEALAKSLHCAGICGVGDGLPAPGGGRTGAEE